MNRPSALIYDIEIKKAILGRGEIRLTNVEYCNGWTDHAGMGISVIGAYDYSEDRYRVFCEDNFNEFVELASRRQVLVTFNGLNFDNKVIQATIPKIVFQDDAGDYDILVELWASVGLGRQFSPRTHGGFGLDACMKANFGTAKTGNGALAPIWWQQGKIASTIDYCLNDVKGAKDLFDQILATGTLINPKDGATSLRLRNPFG